MSIQNFLVQFAFLYAPLLHCHCEQVTPTLMRGPDPKMADIQCLHDKGIKTIISCRTNPQLKKKALTEKLGMNWVWIKTGVFKVPTDDQMDQFRKIVNDPKMQPCYAACEIDMDRTGVYIAASRMVDQHWTEEQMDREFHQHHQKRWWPPFRKYQAHINAYAQKRLAQQAALASGASATVDDTKTDTASAASITVAAPLAKKNAPAVDASAVDATSSTVSAPLASKPEATPVAAQSASKVPSTK